MLSLYEALKGLEDPRSYAWTAARIRGCVHAVAEWAIMRENESERDSALGSSANRVDMAEDGVF